MKLCLSVALAVPLLLAAAAPRDNDCDLKKVEKGWFCAKCDALVEKDGVDKEGKHAECRQKVEECKLCVKTYYVADC